MKNLFTKGYIALLSVITISEISSTMVTPILAFLFFSSDSSLFSSAASHTLRATYYGYAIALGKAGALISSILLGMAMDRYGRKITLMISCLGLSLAMLLCAEGIDKSSLSLFVVGILCTNFLYVGKQSGLAMIGDTPNEKKKVIQVSGFQAFIAIGACIGPFLSGHVVSLKLLNVRVPYSEPFWIGSIFSIFALVLSLVFVGETLKQSMRSEINLKSYWSLLRLRPIWRLFVQIILFQWTWGLFYEFSPAISKIVFHFSPKVVGTYTGLIGFWIIIASLIVIPYLRTKMNSARMKKLSAILLLAGILIAMISTAIPDTVVGEILYWLSPPFAATGDVMFYALIVSEFSNKVPENAQGKMMGLVYIVLTATWALAAFIGGHVLAFYVGSILWLSVIGVVLWLLNSRRYLTRG